MATIMAPLVPRDPHEPHRTATTLELLFDLVTVIAIASAAAGLHHAVGAGHAGEGLVNYLLAFFAIWWAWMSYTWFASAYDNDDVVLRLSTMVMMGGSLVIAAGIPMLFEGLDNRLVVIGYIIMRLPIVILWLRAARDDPARRGAAVRYAIGTTLVQVYWLATLLVGVPETMFLAAFILGILLELAVPALAERRNGTPWHRHHIIERYGLLNIIVLGETLLAAALALRAGLGGVTDMALILIAICAIVIAFTMWWVYFTAEDHLQSDALGHAMLWGYGHYAIFASGAAVGAGIAVQVELAAHHAQTTQLVGNLAVAIPLAIYLVGLWVLRDRYLDLGNRQWALPGAAAIIVVLAFMPFGLIGMAITSILAIVARNAGRTSSQTSAHERAIHVRTET